VARQFDQQYDDVWRYERFITTIEQKAGISWEKAERAARATLETLGERISRGQARDLASDLPHDIGRWLLDAPSAGESFDPAEFVRRVAEREGIDTDTAERHIKAVFVALARLIVHKEVEDLASELSKDYQPLLGEAMRVTRDPSAPEVVTDDELFDRVAGRGGLDLPGAQRAAEAFLQTLAERLAPGEVGDLIEVVPERLRPALQRGKDVEPRRISLDEFIDRVAQREGATWEDALDHARAVMQTLRETIPDKEFSDILHELPRGYYEALL
jgi:uncharacterized protein (DUF2267 family)